MSLKGVKLFRELICIKTTNYVFDHCTLEENERSLFVINHNLADKKLIFFFVKIFLYFLYFFFFNMQLKN